LRTRLQLDEQQTAALAPGESRSVRQRLDANPSSSAALLRQRLSLSQVLASEASSPESVLDASNTTTLRLFRQRADMHPGNTEVTKAYCHDVVTEVAAWLKQQPHKPEIRSLAALQNLWHSNEHAAKTLVKNFNSSGAAPVRMGGGNHDQLDAVLMALAEASRRGNTPVELPPAYDSRELVLFYDGPRDRESAHRLREVEQRQHAAFQGPALAGAALSDEEMVDEFNTSTLRLFRRRTDMHPSNTELTKAYCEEVVTEVAAWLKQQPHKPEIRSLAALQNLWHSDEHAAKTLVKNFNSSGAVPVRMGGNDDQLDAVLIALAEASRGRNTPVELPPSNIARMVERLVYSFFPF